MDREEKVKLMFASSNGITERSLLKLTGYNNDASLNKKGNDSFVGAEPSVVSRRSMVSSVRNSALSVDRASNLEMIKSMKDEIRKQR